MEQIANSRKREPTAFSIYLRTGRRVAPQRLELKFNPWHDPANGRFTFAGRGSIYPGSGGNTSVTDPQPSASEDNQDRAGSDPNYTDAKAAAKENDPKSPQNYSVYVVRPGDSLTRIAGYRKGLKAKDLAWLNEVPLDKPLQIGQRIRVPHQGFLDKGKQARDKFLALSLYMDTHGGRLPPVGIELPPIEQQILDAGFRRVTRNGYTFDIDILNRTRRASGEAGLSPSQNRSRSAQANAGVPHRAPGDEGGHYIARRFGGPTDAFNHFAQNANFNRGRYRALEHQWASELRSGKKVIVDIQPQYVGASSRPVGLAITWYVNGQRKFQYFPNEAGGRANGRK